MANEELERITILLQAKDRDFARAMDRNNKLIARLTRDATKNTEAMSKKIDTSLAAVQGRIAEFGRSFAAGLAGGAVSAAVGALTSNLAATVRGVAQLGDEAKRSGLGIEAFQEWKFVAEQNRIGVDQLVDGFKELSLRADEFIVTGAGPGAKAFARLGLSAAELREKLKDPSELMLEIVDRMQGLDTAAQIRVADEVFGGSAGERFVELLGVGGDRLREMVARSHEVGAVVDEQLIAKAQELDRAWNELTTSISTTVKSGILGIVDLADTGAEAIADLLNKMPGTKAEALVDPGTAAAIAEGAQVSAAAMTDLLQESAKMETQALKTAGMLEELSYILEDMGDAEAAAALGQVVEKMRGLVEQMRQGEIRGTDFQEALAGTTQEAKSVVSELDGISRADFSVAIGAVNTLGFVLGQAAKQADRLRSSMPGSPAAVAGEKDDGRGFKTGDAANAWNGVVVRAPGKDTPRPVAAPVNIDFDWRGVATGGGGGSGGGRARSASDIFDVIAKETIALEAQTKSFLEAAKAGGDYGDAASYASTKARLLTSLQREGIGITPELAARIDEVALAYGRAADAADEASDRLQRTQDSAEAGADAMAGVFSGLQGGIDGLKASFARFLEQVASAQISKAFAGISGGGGFFSAIGSLLGYDTGGYTGSGGRKEPAGIVHRGEVVFSQDDVRRAGGVAAVEAIRRTGAVAQVASSQPSSSAASSGGRISIGFDASVGDLTATMYGVAGEVVEQQRASIVGQSSQVAASRTQRQLGKSKRGWA